jgi:hypothetical protein
MKSSKILLTTIIMILTVSMVQAVTILDFETDDDFITPLENGRQVESMFGNIVNISSVVIGPGSGHLGATIFDSNPFGPNKDSADKDLLVDLGNILMLQNSDYPTQTVPGIFDVPNDEANIDNSGAVIFDFLSPVEVKTIDLIDINGGARVEITMTDVSGKKRIYSAGEKWTQDVAVAGIGWHTLDLQDTLPQPGEPGATGGPAVVIQNDAGYDILNIVKMKVALVGDEQSISPSPSGAIDNLVFVPEPATIALLTLGSLTLIPRRKK